MVPGNRTLQTYILPKTNYNIDNIYHNQHTVIVVKSLQ